MDGLHKTRYTNRRHEICNRGRKDGYGPKSMAKHHGPDGKAEWRRCTRADALGQGQKYNITFYLSSDWPTCNFNLISWFQNFLVAKYLILGHLAPNRDFRFIMFITKNKLVRLINATCRAYHKWSTYLHPSLCQRLDSRQLTQIRAPEARGKSSAKRERERRRREIPPEAKGESSEPFAGGARDSAKRNRPTHNFWR